MADRKERIDLAVAAVKDGMSQRAAAKIYAISRTTLAARLASQLNKRTAHETEQFLSPSLENYLVKVILDLKKAGKTPLRIKVKQIAIYILKKQGMLEKVRKYWVRRFLKRHPELKIKP